MERLCLQCTVVIDRGGNGKRRYCCACARARRRRSNKESSRAAYYNNREQKLAYFRARYSPAKKRADDLRQKYGLPQAQVDEMLRAQGGACAICGGEPTKRGWAIDHCHTTGRVRGVLCGRCNTAIGLLRDSSALCAAAAGYLNRTAA